jgi:hypothetical protein
MRRELVSAASAVVFLALALPAWVSDAEAQVDPQLLQQLRMKAANLGNSNYEKLEAGTGDCRIVRAEPASKKVWLARLSCASGGNLVAGFRLPELVSTLTIPGAKIKATVVVTAVSGKASFQTTRTMGSQGGAFNGIDITAPGTYTTTSPAFDILANQGYKAGAQVYFSTGLCTVGCAFEGRITQLEWEF